MNPYNIKINEYYANANSEKIEILKIKMLLTDGALDNLLASKKHINKDIFGNSDMFFLCDMIHNNSIGVVIVGNDNIASDYVLIDIQSEDGIDLKNVFDEMILKYIGGVVN